MIEYHKYAFKPQAFCSLTVIMYCFIRLIEIMIIKVIGEQFVNITLAMLAAIIIAALSTPAAVFFEREHIPLLEYIRLVGIAPGLPRNPLAFDAVTQYAISHGFDGIYNPNREVDGNFCSCLLPEDTLKAINCSCRMHGCRLGYLMDNEGLHIGPEKMEDSKDEN